MREYKVNKQLGKRIKRIRNEQGLSQEELADKVGIHRTYMGKIERGESNPPIHTIEKIAKALRVAIRNFF